MKYKVALIPGDGIGPEVIREGMKVIDKVSELNDFEIEYREYENGADNYLKTGELITEETLEEMGKTCKAIYLGALGDPRVKPGILEKGILLKIRFFFDQYVNLRPVRLLDGAWCPLRGKRPEHIDFAVVRENTEDFYVGIGDRVKVGMTHQEKEIVRSLYHVKLGLDIEAEGSEIAYQIGVMSRKGAERVIRYAFELAKKRKVGTVHAVDKANVMNGIYDLWREAVEKVSSEYPDINHEFMYVDATAMWFVKNPEWFKVVVAPNMFGDILTDLGAMIQGGLGFAPGGNINPDGISMFEPIHGSAPKYKEKNMANPLAAIWAGALMLGELGEDKSKDLILEGIEQVVKEGKVRTLDMGGTNTTSEMGHAITQKIKELNDKEWEFRWGFW